MQNKLKFRMNLHKVSLIYELIRIYKIQSNIKSNFNLNFSYSEFFDCIYL